MYEVNEIQSTILEVRSTNYKVILWKMSKKMFAFLSTIVRLIFNTL